MKNGTQYAYGWRDLLTYLDKARILKPRPNASINRWHSFSFSQMEFGTHIEREEKNCFVSSLVSWSELALARGKRFVSSNLHTLLVSYTKCVCVRVEEFALMNSCSWNTTWSGTQRLLLILVRGIACFKGNILFVRVFNLAWLIKMVPRVVS